MSVIENSIDLKYISADKPSKKSEVRVEWFVETSRLQVTKGAGNKLQIIHDVYWKDIGAVSTALVKSKPTGKKKKCLFIFWKKSTSDDSWNKIIFIDDPSDTAIDRLKQVLSTKFLLKTFKLMTTASQNTGNVIHELQFSQKYVSIFPESSCIKLKSEEISTYCANTSDLIYCKADDKLHLVSHGKPYADSVTLRTSNGTTLDYVLRDGCTIDMILRELCRKPIPRPRASRLPPVPKPLNPPPLLKRARSTLPPPPDDAGWMEQFVPPNPENPVEIYSPDNEEIAPYLKEKLEHIMAVNNRPSSERFQIFTNSAKFGPTSINPNARAGPVYGTPVLRTSVKLKPESSLDNYPIENLERTLTKCIRKIETSRVEPAESCPLGLTRQERERFCWRLDLVEHDIVQGPAWKTFASHVMHLNDDDLEMLDEFSCKYRYQVVEIILDYWYELDSIQSYKSLLPACKKSIVQVLRQMEKFTLLDKLHWTDECNS